MSQINFVRHRLKKLGRVAEQDFRVFKLSMIGAGVVFVVFLVILGLRIYQVSRLKKIEDTQANHVRQIKSLEEEERAYVFLINKLKALSQIFEERQNKQEAIAYFSQVFGPEVIIDQIVYEARASLLAFGVRTTNIFTLEQVFSTLESNQTEEKFAELHKSELRRNANGTYQMKVTVVMDENATINP